MINANNFFSQAYLNIKYGLKLHKPKLLWRVIRSYTLALMGVRTPLRYIDFAFDYSCNLYCKHCFAVTLRKPSEKKLSLDDYNRIAREAKKIGVFHVSFQGGEPLLMPKTLESIIKTFGADSFYIAVTTNGTLLTKQKVLWLKKIGVDKITISLDSMAPSEHDAFRRVKGTFTKAWDGITESLKAGLNVTINTTLTHQNLHTEGITKIFDFAIKNNLIVNPIFAAPVGRWINETKSLLTKKDVDYVTSLQKESSFIRRDIDSNYFKRGCPAVKEVIYVTPYGDVIPCPFLHIILGNLKKEKLADIIRKGLRVEDFKKYSQKCLAAEDSQFIKKIRLVYRKVKKIPFTVEELNENSVN